VPRDSRVRALGGFGVANGQLLLIWFLCFDLVTLVIAVTRT